MLAAGAKLGRYSVVRTLGVGGMGVVYEAKDTVLRRPVALKILRPKESALQAGRPRRELTARLMREARAAAALRHPNAVAVYDVGETDGTPFIAMELVEGQSLRHLMEENQATIPERLDWLLAIARVLNAAHEQGIVHRDIKPDNVMVDKRGTVKVLDFGIAKPMHELEELLQNSPSRAPAESPLAFRTAAGAVVGTPRYMAPEQAVAGPIDGRADQFAFAIVAIELLTGLDPRETPSEDTVNRAIGLGVPPPIAKAIARAMSADKDARFPTMAAIVDVLEEHTDAKPEPRLASRPSVSDVGYEETLEVAGAAPKDADSSVDDTAPDSVAKTTERDAQARGALSLRFAIGVGAVLGAVILAVLVMRRSPPKSASAPPPASARPSVEQPLRIAVLPITGADAQDYVADGATAEIVSELSREPSLRVVAQSSVKASLAGSPQSDLATVAKQLDVRLVITGAVHKRERELRLTIEVVDPATRISRATHAYVFEADALAPTLRRAATDVLVDVGVSTPPRAPLRGTTSPVAHRAYLQGRAVWNQRTEPALRTALGYFETATKEDPQYAAAWAAIGESYLLLPIVAPMSVKAACDSARPVVDRALAIDPTLSQAHAARASIFEYEWDFAKAQASFEKALEHDPQNPIAHQWYGELLMKERRFDEAIVHMTRALEIDPLSAPIHRNFGQVLMFAKRYEEAKRLLERALHLDPQQPFARVYLQTIAIETGNFDTPAVTRADAGLSMDHAFARTNEVYRHAKRGDMPRARKVAQEIAPLVDADPMLKAYTAGILGDVEVMYTSLEKAIAAHHFLCPWINLSQPFEPYRDTPRFMALSAKIGLPRPR